MAFVGDINGAYLLCVLVLPKSGISQCKLVLQLHYMDLCSA